MQCLRLPFIGSSPIWIISPFFQENREVSPCPNFMIFLKSESLYKPGGGFILWIYLYWFPPTKK